MDDSPPSQPLGSLLADSSPAIHPSAAHIALHGAHVSLHPLSLDHADELFGNLGGTSNSELWTYLLSGPYLTLEGWRGQLAAWMKGENGVVFWTVIVRDAPQEKQEHGRESGVEVNTPADSEDAVHGSKKTQEEYYNGQAIGILALHRIKPVHRTIEVGYVTYSPLLQRTTAATEAMLLLGKNVFETLGYRRWEWKAHALNAPSIKSALRLGFQFDGIFKNHMIVRGRNRDTWWGSIILEDWERVKRGFEVWLREENFVEGRQKRRLEDVRAAIAAQKHEEIGG